jgi:hypothetical protein
MIINLKKFPKTIEDIDPILVYFDGYYVAIIDRGTTLAVYKWDGISEVWNTRDVFDKVLLESSL